MSKLKKVLNALQGLALVTRHVHPFPASILDGKRIAVVGPASSAYNTNKGEYIDGFDFVVRINKAPMLIRDKRSPQDIGTKTDILFHSFFENEFSGGGPLDFALYDQLGIKYVVNPIPGFFGWRVNFNFYKKYLTDRVIYSLPKESYREMKKRFGKFRPTTGITGLRYIMESNFSELYITGFTFFKTSYGEGYRDPMKEVEKTRKYIAEMKIHDPELEYQEFKIVLARNSSKKILLDDALTQILKNEP